MKKIFLVFAVCLLFAFCLTACDFSLSDSNNESSDNQVQADDNSQNKYPWDNTKILVSLAYSDFDDEFVSGCKKFYAGLDTIGADTIDQLVINRNKNSNEETNVSVSYIYSNNSSIARLGQSINIIAREINTNSAFVPDIYCGYAFDLAVCALRGLFMNLYTDTVRSSQSTERVNYFRFAEHDYDPSSNEGYFIEYMQSLAFANSNGEYDKMYLMASEYTIDVVRSFLVMPVNLKLMSSIHLNDNEYATDRDNDGDFDIKDFYKLVWDGDWTYDALAAFSNTIVNKNPETSDIWGAAFGFGYPVTVTTNQIGHTTHPSNEITAAGLLYSSSVQMISRDPSKGQYTYPEENQKLIDFATALNNLFVNGSENGIKSIVANRGDYDALKEIREKFSRSEVLFGGIIALGQVERVEFQSLNNSDGFGIIPIPTYSASNDYVTPIHSFASIVAISKNTTDFEMCSAFLDCQSMNSSHILEAYYRKYLMAESNGLEDNITMINFIQKHAHDSFDLIYDMYIVKLNCSISSVLDSCIEWHMQLNNRECMYPKFYDHYKTEIVDKSARLKDILDSWEALKTK